MVTLPMQHEYILDVMDSVGIQSNVHVTVIIHRNPIYINYIENDEKMTNVILPVFFLSSGLHRISLKLLIIFI